MSDPRKLRAIYLNDHLAGAIGGQELARRSLGQNRDNEFGAFLAELVTEIEEDRATLENMMSALDVGKDRLKVSAAWAVEKVGRLKLNGQVTGYSPLSRLVELEMLALGVEGKLSLWRSLKQAADAEPRLREFDLDNLIRRAQAQRRRLERHRLRAAKQALWT
jgi:hypothetical protein